MWIGGLGGIWVDWDTYNATHTGPHTATKVTNVHTTIVTLLEFCLKNTYFLFQGKYYEHVPGTAMGSSISPLIANLFMEEFEVKALSTATQPPSLWLRFVDDTLVILKAEHSTVTTPHQLTGSPHTIYSTRTRNRWLNSILGHQGYTRTKQHHSHKGLLEANTYWPVFTLEQQSLYYYKKQYIQHTSPQGQSCFQHTRGFGQGTGTH